MNIFYIDEDPVQAARDLCDDHVRKMQIESAQLLCSTHWLTGQNAPYKLTHKNHPCAIWVRDSVQHYDWVLQHGIEVCHEFNKRYGKVHATLQVLNWLSLNYPLLSDNPFVPPPQCMPDIYKHPDTVAAYRTYYIEDKIKIKKLGYDKLKVKPLWMP